MNLSDDVRKRIERYKAKRTALDELRDIAKDARDESERLDRELFAEEREVERIRREVMDDIAIAAGVDEAPPKNSIPP